MGAEGGRITSAERHSSQRLLKEPVGDLAASKPVIPWPANLQSSEGQSECMAQAPNGKSHDPICPRFDSCARRCHQSRRMRPPPKCSKDLPSKASLSNTAESRPWHLGSRLCYQVSMNKIGWLWRWHSSCWAPRQQHQTKTFPRPHGCRPTSTHGSLRNLRSSMGCSNGWSSSLWSSPHIASDTCSWRNNGHRSPKPWNAHEALGWWSPGWRKCKGWAPAWCLRWRFPARNGSSQMSWQPSVSKQPCVRLGAWLAAD